MSKPNIPLDADLAAIIDALPPSSGGSIFDLGAEVARGIFESGIQPPDAASWVGSIASIEDGFAEEGGLRVPLRVYRPRRNPSRSTVVFFHGGGFILGGINQMDGIARRLCRDISAVVVSVGYRLAPENQFPAAHQDAIAAVRWVKENATRLGGDASRVALVGESAGGNLAIFAALATDGVGESLAGLLLVVPAVDLSAEVDDTYSPLLNASDLKAITRLYLGTDLADTRRFPPSPLYAPCLSTLPTTVLAIAGYDALRPSLETFATRLNADGVTVLVRRYDSMFHPFFGFAEYSAGAASASAELCSDIRRILDDVPEIATMFNEES